MASSDARNRARTHRHTRRRWGLTLRNPAGQTIERHLGQYAARLHPRRRRIEIFHRAQRHALMLAAPPPARTNCAAPMA
jgi:hypothetical protein